MHFILRKFNIMNAKPKDEIVLFIILRSYRYFFKNLKYFCIWFFFIGLPIIVAFAVLDKLLHPYDLFDDILYLTRMLGVYQNVITELKAFAFASAIDVLCAPLAVMVMRDVLLSERHKPFPYGYYVEGYFQRTVLVLLLLFGFLHIIGPASDGVLELILKPFFVFLLSLSFMTFILLRCLFLVPLYSLGETKGVLRKNWTLTYQHFWSLCAVLILAAIIEQTVSGVFYFCWASVSQSYPEIWTDFYNMRQSEMIFFIFIIAKKCLFFYFWAILVAVAYKELVLCGEEETRKDVS